MVTVLVLGGVGVNNSQSQPQIQAPPQKNTISLLSHPQTLYPKPYKTLQNPSKATLPKVKKDLPTKASETSLVLSGPGVFQGVFEGSFTGKPSDLPNHCRV